METSKKRGRPPKYSSKEEKAAANARQKRMKRHSERDLDHAFRAVQFPEVPLGLPPAIDSFVAGYNVNTSRGSNSHKATDLQAQQNVPDLPNQDEGDDLALFLPPDSPPMDPVLNSWGDLGDPASAIDIATDSTNFPETRIDSNTVEQSTGLAIPIGSSSTDRNDLAQRIADQLVTFRGCCTHCHDTARSSHAYEHSEHVSLGEYVDAKAGTCPDILASERVALHGDKLIDQTAAASRRSLYTGIDSGRGDQQEDPPHICLHKDEQGGNSVTASFDVDSVVGFPSSLAVARQGIRWHPTQTSTPALKSSLHLHPRQVFFEDENGTWRSLHRQVHEIPHYTFGRLVGFEDISLCLLFPRLYRQEQQSSRIRDQDFQLWMDGILLPAIYEHYSSSHAQHFPSSFEHGRYNSTARGVETLAQRVDSTPREQQLASYLSPEGLTLVWERMVEAVQQPPYHHFQGVTILLQAKNLKLLTKDFTWDATMSRFQGYWDHAIDETFITPDIYFDIGKEICPAQSSRSYSSKDMHESEMTSTRRATDSTNDIPAETLLWKRCCLESYKNSFQHTSLCDPTQKQTFYPFSMLRETGSLTAESSHKSMTRAAGLLYTQLYPSAKEMFAAGDVYPFRNPAIETLALDKRLRRTWELVGGGLSHNPVPLIKAYIHTKLRCHFALRGSARKSFGVGEEYRVSKALFRQIDTQFRSRAMHDQRFLSQTTKDDPFYTFTTVTLTKWLRWNVNKFCLGFETVCSSQDPYFVTWEHTRIMLMFLRCLEFAYSGGLIQKAGGCWQDVRFQDDTRHPNGLRRVEGLGFRHTMEKYGYAWFLDKVDWVTFTFRQPHAPYMMFNNPSMQTAYRARYRQIRDVRVDFIRIDRVRQWMTEFSGTPASLDILEDYMCQLCLCAFRKDVFTHIQSIVLPDCRETALAGEIPLCYSAVSNVLQESERTLLLARGHRLAVKSVDSLFAWLWEWKDGHFERQGWNKKPYRMLFYQAFHVVQAIRGQYAARGWRKRLKTSFLRSHWMLPYPHGRGFMRRDKATKRFMWWPTFNEGLNNYYERLGRYGSQKQSFPASNIKHHPADGWTLATGSSSWHTYMPHVVEPEKNLLERAENEIYADLVRLQEQGLATDIPPERPEARVLEFSTGSKSIENVVTKWCDKRRKLVPLELHDCQSPLEYSRFLRQELEKYEILQHHRRSLRDGRRHTSTAENGSFQNHARSPSADTSDEESLSTKRKSLAETVHRIARKMQETIAKERLKYAKPDLWDPLVKLYEFRLSQVE